MLARVINIHREVRMPSEVKPLLDESRVGACARYIMERTKFVIESFGERPPGSDGERKALGVVREDMAECCDGEILVEPFSVAKRAFASQQAVAATFAMVGIVLFFVNPLLSVAFDIVAIATLYSQLIRYWLFLDPFFAKGVSCNVYGKIRPEGQVKRRIILTGHADAASEFRFNYLAPKIFPIISGMAIIGILTVVVLHLAGATISLFNGSEDLLAKIAIVQVCLIPFVVLGGLYNNINQTVPGANDNLSGTFMVTGIARQLREAGVKLKHTELGVAVLGSEEAGLRGAKVFARAHKKDFEDVETIVVVIDTVRDLEHFKIYNKDLNGTVKHDSGVVTLLKKAGEACGLKLSLGTVYLGSTDATAFTQAGWRACALAAMDPHPADYYHTRRDNWDNMDENCLRKGIEVLAAAIQLYDDQSETC
jgi:hypothetical protein